MLIFRAAVNEDIAAIKDIYDGAISFMADCGLHQWKGGYPFSETPSDIENNILYVLADSENGAIAAVSVITLDGDESYNRIYDGAWLSDGSYAAIHRIAISASYRRQGCGSRIVAEAEKIALEHDIHSIRVDTKHDNLVMQGMLAKNGFTRCGIIILASGNAKGEERIAFEKLI